MYLEDASSHWSTVGAWKREAALNLSLKDDKHMFWFSHFADITEDAPEKRTEQVIKSIIASPFKRTLFLKNIETPDWICK
jgi:hypothetical protein